MSNARILELLKENFGGSLYTYHPGNPNHHDWSIWRTTDKRARDVINALRPYLIAKRPQSDVVVDFIDICEAQWQQIRRTQRRPYHLTPEMLVLRDHYWQKVTALNSNAMKVNPGDRLASCEVPGDKGEKAKLYSAMAMMPVLGAWMQSTLTGLVWQDLLPYTILL